MSLPDVVPHEEWLRARAELLAREKEPKGRVESARRRCLISPSERPLERY